MPNYYFIKLKKMLLSTADGYLRSILIRGCARNKSRKYPNVQWGYGTLDLIRAFNYLREY